MCTAVSGRNVNMVDFQPLFQPLITLNKYCFVMFFTCQVSISNYAFSMYFMIIMY